ncbi:MAG TPA: class I tRNA ligase family protein, partial [Gemmatimonadaceae bacterium]|nr:class I tRNA ligase family protein [Gemmatimonadaceae bacterium]
APFAPHIADELWERLGHTGTIFASRWPTFDPALAIEDEVELAVQVNGKLRGTVRVARDTQQDQAVAAALAVPSIAKFVTGTPRTVIFVAGRLLNLVV